MLTRVQIRNFRSIQDLEWHPQRLSVLTGPNNSGKTNLAYALRFLSLTAQGLSLDEAARASRMAPTEVRCLQVPDEAIGLDLDAEVGDGPEAASLGYRLELKAEVPDERGVPVLTVAAEKLWRRVPGGGQTLFQRGPEAAELVDGAPPGPQGFTAWDWSPAHTVLGKLTDKARYPSVWTFASYLRNFHYYRVDASSLGSAPEAAVRPILLAGAENLLAVLHLVKNQDARAYSRLLGMASQLDPSLEDFEFVPLADGTVVTEAILRGVEDRVSIRALSDGTLLHLALAVVALQPQVHSRREFERPTLIVFEEPENGLYVRALHSLFDLITEASQHTQVIITTHSPFLLDFFDDAPEKLFVLSRGDRGTEIRSPDPGAFDELLEHMSVGEMLFRKVLACE